MTDKLCFIICENFRKEMFKVIEAEGINDVKVVTFPANCIRKTIDPDILKKIIHTKKKDCSDIYLFGGFCVSGLDESSFLLEHCHLHKMDQCYYLFARKEFLEPYFQKGAMVITPGWLVRWQYYIMKEWGFDQPTAQDFFRESISKLVLLDTGIGDKSSQLIQELADFVRIPFEIIPIGLDYFRLKIIKIIFEWRQEKKEQSYSESFIKANRLSAGYAMAFDLMGEITGAMKEEKVIKNIFEVFKMLFAPANQIFTSISEGKIVKIWSSPYKKKVIKKVKEEVESFQWQNEYYWDEQENSLFLKISYQKKISGILKISNIAFPEYIEAYLNIALNTIKVFGLAIENARTYHELKKANLKLKEISICDGLTGLYNKKEFHLRLKNEIGRSNRFKRPFSLLMMDIDHFKKINDNYGHPAGDEVLRAMTALVKKRIRKIDQFARIGGEEFAIILSEITLSGAMTTAENLRKLIASTEIDLGGNKIVKITMSFGVAEFFADAVTEKEIFSAADKALYEAKETGRNKVCNYGELQK